MMTKKDFLDIEDVQAFTTFLAEKWEGGFDFVLKFSQKGSSKNKQPERISSLKEAFEKYVWDYSVSSELKIPDSIRTGTTFEDANKVLSYCEQKLQEGLNGDEEKLRNASAIVLSWGGVFIKGNKDVLSDSFLIKQEYQKIIELWSKLSENEVLPNDIDFRSNAGFTKIYSLFLSDYIIYDSRVAAAFALLIQQYFNSNNKEFNSVLKLDIPKGRESANSEDRRDIGDNFGTFTKDYKKHFSSNVKASWLLSKTVEKVKESNPDSKIKLRELEAALFMIGYDIRQN